MKKKKCQEVVEQTRRNITPQQSQRDFNVEKKKKKLENKEMILTRIYHFLPYYFFKRFLLKEVKISGFVW